MRRRRIRPECWTAGTTDPDVGSRYGVLMDAHYYRNLHGDSVSMVDTMRIRMEPIPEGNEIYYYDRNNLIEIDDSSLYSDDIESLS